MHQVDDHSCTARRKLSLGNVSQHRAKSTNLLSQASMARQQKLQCGVCRTHSRQGLSQILSLRPAFRHMKTRGVDWYKTTTAGSNRPPLRSFKV